MVGLFLLGIYLLVRSVSKSVSKVPRQVVKEIFGLVKKKISKPKHTVHHNHSKSPTLIPMTYTEWQKTHGNDSKPHAENEREEDHI